MPRFGLSAYPAAFTRKLVTRAPDKKARKAYDDRLTELRRRGSGMRILLLEDYTELNRWLTKQYRLANKLPVELAIHFAKYYGLIGRLMIALYAFEMKSPKSALFTDVPLVDTPSIGSAAKGKIPAHIVSNAIKIIDTYLKPHAKRLYKAVDHVEGQTAGQMIAEIILEDSTRTRITAYDIIRRRRTGLSSNAVIVAGFGYLSAMGWGRYEEQFSNPGKRGPRSKSFLINSSVHGVSWGI